MYIVIVKPLKTDINKDYYPFGMLLPNRKGAISGGEYRYAFNGMETDKEVSGGSKNGNEDQFSWTVLFQSKRNPSFGSFPIRFKIWFPTFKIVSKSNILEY